MVTVMTVFYIPRRVLSIRHRLDPAVRGYLSISIPASRRLGASRVSCRARAFGAVGHPLALRWDSDPRPFTASSSSLAVPSNVPSRLISSHRGGADGARLDDDFVRRRSVRVIGLQEGSFGPERGLTGRCPQREIGHAGQTLQGARWAVAAPPRMWRPAARSGCVAATLQSL